MQAECERLGRLIEEEARTTDKLKCMFEELRGE